MLEPKKVKELSRVSNIRPLLDIALCWGTIAGSLYLCSQSLWWAPLAVIVVSTRLHALTVMMHDGSHYLLNRNKTANELISNLLCSFPLMLSTEAYRQTHLPHHRHTQTEGDPNFVTMQKHETWNFPKRRKRIKELFLRDFLLLSVPDHMLILKDWQVLPNFSKITKLEKTLFPLFVCGVLGGVVYYGLWAEFAVFQVSALYINPASRLRAMSEHIHQRAQGQGRVHKLRETPTVNANWLEKFFIAPLNTNRHLEHHLFPTIPYYNLNKVHEEIKKTDMYQEHCAYELDGYLFGRRRAIKEVLEGVSVAAEKGKEKLAA